ncbi:MAG: hypothetical protein JO272_03400 [Pseudonocardiales bacterium]|nr:hypothetical protein [Pseudonocardiales bacterium]
MIAVEVNARAVYEGTYREPIVDAGTAMLDRLVWVAAPYCRSRWPPCTRTAMPRSPRTSES